MGRYAEHVDGGQVALALSCCRGKYQTNVVMGHEPMSGSTLKGRARQYAGRYAASRDNMLRRMRRTGVLFHVAVRDHGRKVLVIG